jgi:hypothetical protein
MKTKLLVATTGLLCLALSLYAQDPGKNGSASTIPAPAAITAETTPADLAKAAFIAQGGEKFRSVQNMLLRGSVQLYAPNSVQSIPGSFSLVTAGDKMRMEVDARPAIVFKQIFDGQNSYSSMPGVQPPPFSRFGLVALAKFDQPGVTVSALPDKKKQRGFRIADADGYTTDYYLDPKTGRVISFMFLFEGITGAMETSKFKEMEGVLVPWSFSQRFEMPQGAFFAEFSVKEVKLNQTLGDDAFAIPR